MGQWGRLENAVLSALPDDVLPLVTTWPEEAQGKEARHCLAELREALGDKDKTAEQLLEAHGRDAFLAALCSVACPSRQGDRKPKGWFKSFDGGYLLADKLLGQEPRPDELSQKIETFLTKIRAVVAT